MTGEGARLTAVEAGRPARCAILIVASEMQVAREFLRRVLVLDYGCILEEKSPDRMLTDSQKPRPSSTCARYCGCGPVG